MDRELEDEFVALLARLVMEGFITEQTAVDALRTFYESGALPPGWELPLPIALAIPGTLRERLVEALLLYAANPPQPSPDVAQSRFMTEARAISREYRGGDVSLREWHEAMLGLIIDYLARQAQEGAQRAIVDEDELFEQVYVQVAFLSRFADQAASGRLSDDQIINRSALYSGEGRAIYYEQYGRANALYGWVDDYIAVDDRNTCGPCSSAEANGPYLPGQGPMPGRVCLGRGYCRCLRLPRYDEAAYLRLSG